MDATGDWCQALRRGAERWICCCAVSGIKHSRVERLDPAVNLGVCVEISRDIRHQGQ